MVNINWLMIMAIKRIMWVLILVLLISFVSAYTPNSDYDYLLNNGVSIYLACDNGTGLSSNAIAYDSTGNGNNGTVTGAVISATAQINTGYDFERLDNDQIITPYYLPNDDFSVSLWAKIEAGDATLGMFTTHSDIATQDGFRFTIASTVNKLAIRSQGINHLFTNATNLSEGVFYHV